MNFQLFISFLVPVLMISWGLVIKFLDNDAWSSYKKYWLYVVIVGVLLLVSRFYKYLM